jgi:hypothetical protein
MLIQESEYIAKKREESDSTTGLLFVVVRRLLKAIAIFI